VLLLAGVVMAVHIIKVRPTPSSPASSDEIRVNSLVRLDCYSFEVRYSENAREQVLPVPKWRTILGVWTARKQTKPYPI
jgi:hypothetical protein